MNENTFDKHIKDNLYNYESPVSSGLWDKIVAEKDKKKPVPPPFWKNGYLQSAVIAVVAIALLISTYSSLSKNNSQASNATNKQNNTVVNTPVGESSINNSTTLSVNKTTEVSDNHKEKIVTSTEINNNIAASSLAVISKKTLSNKRIIPSLVNTKENKTEVLVAEVNEPVSTASTNKIDIIKEPAQTASLVNTESVANEKDSYFPAQG